jgi:hypothetical protein
MGDLLAQHPTFGNIKINNIMMPGSHDSGTFNTGAATSGDHTARTQSLDINHQLAAGVRYFDLRIKVRNSVFYAYHGPWMSNNDLGTKNDNPDTASNKYLFRQMRDFLKAHPHEILILKYQNFKDFGHDDYVDLVNMMEKYFTFPGCGLVKLREGTAKYINEQTLNTLIKANMRVFVFFDKEDVPNERIIWDHVFQYTPSLKKTQYALWDPYWHDEDSSLADDNVDLQKKWWNWHQHNLDTWNSNGFFVLQSHMQQLPGKESDAYFNISEQVAAATYHMQKDKNGKYICNNSRNIKKYIDLFNAGNKLNIITFDFIQHGNICEEMVNNYKKVLPKA